MPGGAMPGGPTPGGPVPGGAMPGGAMPGGSVPLPAGFTPVSASRCVVAVVTVPGDGEWQVRREQRADGPFEALVAALRQPDGRPGAGVACAAIGYVPITITLTDAAGHAVEPAIPHNGCGAPLPAAVNAIGALDWRTVTETRVSRMRTQLELDTGCPGSYKPVLDMAGTKVASPGPVFPATTTSLTVCRYRLDPSNTLTMSGRPLQIGTLDTASTIDGPRVPTLLAALAAAAPAAACTRPQSPFALLFPEGAGSARRPVVVELAGCHRMLDPADALRQLDDATLTLLR